ncbi:MAG: HAMP domain-containing sensor histidine kinase, partial [Nitrosospira sp.]
MMHEFLAANRTELIKRCKEKVAQRPARKATEQQLEHGIPLFLEQLIRTLQIEQTPNPMQSRKVSGPSGGGKTFLYEIGKSATQHGSELLRLGFTVDQVVHDYGDLCQSITDLAFELYAEFSIDEFRTLNRCLDNGIADAVTEFSYQHDRNAADRQALAMNERLGFLAHELRNFLSTAMLALTAIKTSNVGLFGATGAVLDRSLVGLQYLIENSLTDVRMAAGISMDPQLFSLADFINEVRNSASLDAQVRECVLSISVVDPLLAIDGDRSLLFSALGNLLQNAFKFTSPNTEVKLNAYASGDRILIDVIDHCGGLSPGLAEKLFRSFTQHHSDKTGLGLGLSISGSVAKKGALLQKIRSVVHYAVFQ